MINHPFGCFEKKKVFCNPYNHYYPLLSLAAQCGIGMTGEATKLKLEIYDGPHCSAPDGKVAFSAEAIIIGFPDPGIDFGDDSNVSPLGPCRVEVSVKAGESYTLTATNSQGTASASIVLEEECREESAGKDEDSGEDAEEIEVELEAESEPAEEDNSDDSMTEGVKKDRGQTEEEPEYTQEEPEATSRKNIIIRADENMSGLIARDGTIRHGTSPILIGDTTAPGRYGLALFKSHNYSCFTKYAKSCPAHSRLYFFLFRRCFQ